MPSRSPRSRVLLSLAAVLMLAALPLFDSAGPSAASTSRALLARRSPATRVTAKGSAKQARPSGDQQHLLSANEELTACHDTTELADPQFATIYAAICTQTIKDLAGIGSLLELPILTPTTDPNTDPLRISLNEIPSAPYAAETYKFRHGVSDHPCGIEVDAQLSWTTYTAGEALEPGLLEALAHEVVHCYQNQVFAAAGLTATHPRYLVEGSAAYLGDIYSGYELHSDFWYAEGKMSWLGDPPTSLTARSYDAIGWYYLLAKAEGHPLWSTMADAWRDYASGGDAAYINKLGGNAPEVEKAWGSSLLNTPSWGDAWSTPGLVVPDARSTAVADPLDAAHPSNVATIVPWAANVELESSVDSGLIEISVKGGYVSLHDTKNHNYLAFTDMIFCLGKSCADTAVSCVPGGPPLKLSPLSAQFTLAASSGAQGATYLVSRIASPADPSSPVALPPSSGACSPSAPQTSNPQSGYSEGDPHLETVNGGTYDFQAAGEFTLVRSESGDLDIQTRQQPALDSSDVAWNTAVAMRVVSTTVEVDPGDPPIVLVNGERIALSAARVRHLRGGGRLSNDGHGDVVVDWPDGSKADVFADDLGENVTFVPPAPGIDDLRGLLTALAQPRPAAPASASASEVLTGGNGKHYRLNPSSKVGFHTLYTVFANSWRITQRQSLFHYVAGKDTASYTVPGFPSRQLTVAALPKGARTAAERACRAARVTNEALLADCVLDVGATGQKKLATATARVQTIATVTGLAAPGVRGVSTIDRRADTLGAIVVDARGTGYVAWDDKGSGTRPSSVHFCKIPRAGRCATPLELPLPVANANYGVDQPFAVLGAVPGVVYVVGPTYVPSDVVIWTSTNGGTTFSAPYAALGDYAGGTSIGDVLRDPGSPSASLSGSSTEDEFDLTSSNPGAYFSVALNGSAGGPGTSAGGGSGIASSFATDATLGFAAPAADSQVEAFVDPFTTPTTVALDYENGGSDIVAQSWAGPVKVADGTLPRLASGPDGLFLLSEDDTSPHEPNPTLLDVRKYDPTSHTFGPRTVLTNDVALSSGSLVGAPGDFYENSQNGHLYVVWPGIRKADGATVLRLWSSDNGGRSWSKPSDIAVLGAGDSTGPLRFSVAANGSGFLTFADASGLELIDLASLSK